MKATPVLVAADRHATSKFSSIVLLKHIFFLINIMEKR
jgi:hypothetical protein